MNCPHCQKDLAANYSANWCPFCGRDLYEVQTPSVKSPKTNWLIFFAVLLAPAMLSLIGLACNIGTLVVLATFGGSLVAGKICSNMLDERWGMSSVGQGLLTIALAALCFFLCFVGCAVAVPLAAQLKNH
jgi:hypothetical protein